MAATGKRENEVYPLFLAYGDRTGRDAIFLAGVLVYVGGACFSVDKFQACDYRGGILPEIAIGRNI